MLFRSETHAFFGDDTPCLPQEVPGRRIEHPHAGVGEQTERGLMETFDLIGREWTDRRKRVAEGLPRLLPNTAVGTPRPRPVATAHSGTVSEQTGPLVELPADPGHFPSSNPQVLVQRYR